MALSVNEIVDHSSDEDLLEAFEIRFKMQGLYNRLFTELERSIIRRLKEGEEMSPTNFPQFYNPEKHDVDCDNPDKLFRFCECSK